MLIQLLLPIELKLNSNMKGLKFGHFGSMLIPHKQKNTSLIVGFNTIPQIEQNCYSIQCEWVELDHSAPFASIFPP